jgi:hypothetical protein
MRRPARVALALLAGMLALLPGPGGLAEERPPGPPNPVITGLSPSSGASGTVVNAVLRGHDLAGGTVQILGPGVRVLDASVHDPSTHLLRIFIDPDAPPGPRTLTIVVTARGMTGMASTTFWVSP